mmetsp:Transcript_39348/g.35037  ORF Transcript_39348/g.35037 Transcript_39348/m.35037 type:complete len:122 (-) Transcript_39348:1285-1650(-)
MGKNNSKQLSPKIQEKALSVFRKIDTDGSKTIDKAETLKFWKNNFAKLSTDALFKSVDADNNGAISEDEWMFFWEEVKKAGHTDQEIIDELDNLEKGESWVYFDKVPQEKNMLNTKNKKNF